MTVRALVPSPARAVVTEPRAGFTLIEVLIALAIAGIGLAGVTALLVVSSRATSYARHAAEASVLAEDRLEHLRALPAAQLRDGSDVVDAIGRPATDGFARRWTVTPAGALYRVTVQVAWREVDGARELTLDTLRSR